MDGNDGYKRLMREDFNTSWVADVFVFKFSAFLGGGCICREKKLGKIRFIYIETLKLRLYF